VSSALTCEDYWLDLWSALAQTVVSIFRLLTRVNWTHALCWCLKVTLEHVLICTEPAVRVCR
jgi:hypothetical protein